MSKVEEFNGQVTENKGAVIDAEYKEVNQEQPQEGGAEAAANAEQPKPAADAAPKSEPKEGFWKKVWKGAKKAFPFVVTGALCALGGTWLGKHLGMRSSDIVDATEKVVQDVTPAAPAIAEQAAPALEMVSETAQDVVQSLTE